MQCPDCGYLLTALDKTCPRCDRLKSQPPKPADHSVNTHARIVSPKTGKNYGTLVFVVMLSVLIGVGIGYFVLQKNQVPSPTPAPVDAASSARLREPRSTSSISSPGINSPQQTYVPPAQVVNPTLPVQNYNSQPVNNPPVQTPPPPDDTEEMRQAAINIIPDVQAKYYFNMPEHRIVSYDASISRTSSTEATSRVVFVLRKGNYVPINNEVEVKLRKYDRGWSVDSWKPVNIGDGLFGPGG